MNFFFFLNYWGKKPKTKHVDDLPTKASRVLTDHTSVNVLLLLLLLFFFSFMSQLNALDVFCAQAYAYTIVSVPITGRTSEEKVEILQMSCSWVDLVVKMETASVTGEHF